MRDDYPGDRRDNFWKILDYLSIILLIIGGLNWALVGLADIDAIAAIFGIGSIISRVLYTLMGLAALYYIFQWKDLHYRDCSAHDVTGRPTDTTNTRPGGNNC